MRLPARSFVARNASGLHGRRRSGTSPSSRTACMDDYDKSVLPSGRGTAEHEMRRSACFPGIAGVDIVSYPAVGM